MLVTESTLEQLFKAFAQFVSEQDSKPFINFKTSGYIDATENYKRTVYNEARNNLRSTFWKVDNIGTGSIQKSVAAAIQTEVVHNYKAQGNNLIDWRLRQTFAKRGNEKSLESVLFSLYKNKASDKDLFQSLIDLGLKYQLIAYLFFIKDCQKYLPISQERFDKIFELLGISDFKTRGNVSWENYSSFLNVIKEVKIFLRSKDKDATLLDAHSFLWIVGRLRPEESLATKFETILDPSSGSGSFYINTPVVEEDEEATFPEGAEVFRLHKSKERNRELVLAAKRHRMRTDTRLRCDVCEFSFADTYGEAGIGFIEAHHMFPVSELKQETEAKLEDLAMVCANCHRMLHRVRPWKTIEQLKALLRQ